MALTLGSDSLHATNARQGFRMKTIGMITIGQTPRDDLMPQFQALLGSGYRLAEAGALDGLTHGQVAELSPRPGQFPLITRLADSTEVVIGKEAILPHLQGCIDRLEDEADLFCVLCTGTFPRFRTARPLLESDRILFASLQAVFRGDTLGVLLPIPEQAEAAASRWGAAARRLAVEAESPYHGPEGLRQCGERFRAAGAELIVVDCMGFTQQKKDLLREVTGVPVLLPSTLLARFIAELA